MKRDVTATRAAEPLLERALRRDRLVAIGGISLLTLFAWLYLLMGAGTGMSPSAMTTWRFPPDIPALTGAGEWTGVYWLLMAAMWQVMMIAMMTPAAAPVVLLHARVTRHARRQDRVAGMLVPTASFLGGYLAVWMAFSVAATVLQWALEQARLVDGMLMWSTSRQLTGALLILAGLYQLSPWKALCLSHCRSPAEWLARHWRPGRRGAFLMGVRHGAYCLGCCWTLMLLLFAGGVMNLVWIAGLSILVLVEKAAPFGRLMARLTAATCLVAGVALLAIP